MSPSPQPDLLQTISWQDVEATVGGGTVRVTSTQVLGYRLFTIMVGLLGILFAMVVLYALATWPRSREVTDLFHEVVGPERAETLRQLRADWRTDVRQMAELLIIGPIVPILSAIVGFILGRNPDHTAA